MIGGSGRGRGDANPLGGPIAVAAWAVFLVVAIGLTLAARGGLWLGPPRALVEDLTAPGRAIAATPFVTARSVLRGFGEHWRVHKENERLRAENRELREWYDLAHTLLDKSERYEELLAFNPEPAATSIAARVVAETAGPFVRSRLMNVGREHGAEPGQAVMNERGLVGRVVASGRRTSRVLLLGDLNSRIPVMVERTDARAILAGDNSARPRLEFLSRNNRLVAGDRIVTSGDGGEFPRGLIVGEARGADGEWRVRLFANDAPVDYVRVLQYRFPAAPEDEPPAAAPEDAPEPVEEGGGATIARATGGAG